MFTNNIQQKGWIIKKLNLIWFFFIVKFFLYHLEVVTFHFCWLIEAIALLAHLHKHIPTLHLQTDNSLDCACSVFVYSYLLGLEVVICA